MSISVEYLHEPKLQFGKYFEHQDTRPASPSSARSERTFPVCILLKSS